MLDEIHFGNPLSHYLAAAGVFVAAYAGFTFLRSRLIGYLRRLTEKTKSDFDDLLVDLLGMIRSPEKQLLSVFLATRPLTLPEWFDRGLGGVVLVVVGYRVVTMIQRLIGYIFEWALRPERGGQDQSYRTTARALQYVTSLALWGGAVLFILSNLGFNISSMVAGLGIGGVAIALSAQAVLADVFAALALYLDRPFVIGEFIVAGDVVGTVDRIGLKTTRIRALSGELLAIPNASLASARIHNYSRMSQRRIVFSFGVLYQTPAAKLKKIPGIVKAVVEAAGQARLDRCHFKSYGASSLDFETVYIVLSPDYNLYMDLNQKIMVGIFEAFEKEGIGFAYPTRTVILEKAAA